MLAADGSEVATVGEMWGELVPVREMAPVLPEAVLAIEDRRFYTHGGIDAFGVIRAAWQNAVEGRVVAGGSTISQQVAKLVFLSPERTVRRKIQEAMLAFWLEREFTKEEILTIYLNRAYFGAGAYGVDAAARRYFGRSARDIDVAQAAMIAGLLKAPSRFSPANDLALARKRAGLVVDAMVDAGFLSESDGMAASERARTLTVAPAKRAGGGLLRRLGARAGAGLRRARPRGAPGVHDPRSRTPAGGAGCTRRDPGRRGRGAQDRAGRPRRAG